MKTSELLLVSQMEQWGVPKQRMACSSSLLMDGFVSLTSNLEAKQPVNIWRDSGAFQSVIFAGPSAVSALGFGAVVEEFGGRYCTTPETRSV